MSDGNGGSDTATVLVSVAPVNDPPTAGDDSVTVAEDSGPTLVNVLANDSSAPDTGARCGGGHPAGLGWVSVTLSGGVVRFTPAANFNGTTAFFYVGFTDFNGGTATAKVTVTVTPVNDPADGGG